MTGTAYHHGKLRETLVDAAVAAVREGASGGLSLRELTRRVGVSHNAAYRHFAGRDQLVAEVASRVMASLVETIQRRLDAVDTVGGQDPVLRARRRLAECGRGYVEFALAEPGLFRLAFASLPEVGGAGATPDTDPYLLLGQALDDLVDVGFLAAEARAGAEITCWSAVHGFASLAMDGALQAAPIEERDAALERVLFSIDRSYAATSGAVVAPDDLRA